MTCHSQRDVLSLPSIDCFLIGGKGETMTQKSLEVENLSNFDRLRAHLTVEHLASHLLNGWLADRTKDTDELLCDLEAYYERFGALKNVTVYRNFAFVEFLQTQVLALTGMKKLSSKVRFFTPKTRTKDCFPPTNLSVDVIE